MRIAILGGSFDPIHNGHLQIAKTALKKLPIDEVWFVPTKSSPLKQAQQASFEQRYQMIVRAIRPYRHMRVNCIENELDGTSYTIQCVEALKNHYPKDTFCWLIGDDQAQDFHRWKDAERLKSILPFYVFSRVNETLCLPEGMKRVEMDVLDVSSSEIKLGKKLYCVPKGVLNYIGKEGLYVESIVAAHMSNKRYMHSLSVAKLCASLAKAHNEDEKIAYQMGLLHDICKELPFDAASSWMKIHEPNKMSQSCAIWHGYIGASYIRSCLHMYDHRISESVYHHVLGRNRTTFDRILFIADKLDPSRGFDATKELEIAKKDLKKGFAIVLALQQEYLEKEDKING
ncbi:MAG: nicotinate (nicotinamide) nucleotide adenylyltransferase [Longicatena sp.]